MERRADLDFIKGFSILAVIFYHIGILPFGYLGVDVFFVISGFLIVPPVLSQIRNGEFRYLPWLWRRFKRFLPLVVIVCAVSLIIGYFLMMPDDYENLAQSSTASELFANNILLSITTRDYWASANEYKPLLALWYLGIIAQFFVIFPLIFICIKKTITSSFNQRNSIISLCVIALISFILYTLPIFDPSQKFYYLPFRIWELCIGALAFYSPIKNNNTHPYLYITLSAFLLVILSLCPVSLNDINNITIIGASTEDAGHNAAKQLMLITTVIVSVFLIKQKISLKAPLILIAYIGRMSLSLFIWHQVVLAFMRYSFTDITTFSLLAIYLVCVFVISIASYQWIEKMKITGIFCKVVLFASWLCVLGVSLFIYYRAGVLKDVPEMGVTTENPYTVRNTEYIDRIYAYNQPFATDKIKVLVIGNSFARDFICCLEEWDKSRKLDISYMPDAIIGDKRFNDADVLFFFGDKKYIPEWVWNSITPDCEVYGIGTKNFGKTFGQIYRKKGSDTYYNASVPMPILLKKTNDEWKKSWDNHYIDFVAASLNENGEIRIFTPDSMIISFDCMHLSPAGAAYFASRLGFDEIFDINEQKKQTLAGI